VAAVQQSDRVISLLLRNPAGKDFASAVLLRTESFMLYIHHAFNVLIELKQHAFNALIELKYIKHESISYH
jgi:hypothetical protein